MKDPRRILLGAALLATVWSGSLAAADAGKRGVLVLGYDCNEPNWEETVWGTPPDRPGRLVRAAAEAIETGASLTVISGSARCADGGNEARWMRDLLLENAEDLAKFTVYPSLQDAGAGETRDRLAATIALEENARNTAENVANTCAVFRRAGVSEVTLVTSPDHVSRALRDALALWGEDCPELAARLRAAPSVTPYSARTPEDERLASVRNVAVAEPPVTRKLDVNRILKLVDNPRALEALRKVVAEFGR